MPREGYIALWRKSLDSSVFQHEGLWKLWCLCLMKANHKKCWLPIEGILKPIQLLPGQFITGRFSLHKEYYKRKRKNQKTPLTLWRWMQTLEKLGNLNIKTNNKYSIITIINWDSYQNHKKPNEHLNEQQMNNRRTTDEQQMNTNNNDNNEKNDNKGKFKSDSIEYRLANYLLNFILNRNPNHKKPDIQKWSKQIDLMIRIDRREPKVIKKVIEWCQADIPDKQPEGTWKGWANNILSTTKLREKFDILVLKIQEKEEPKHPQTLTKKDIDKLNE